jgi:uncharacterized protein YqeY
VVLKDKINDDLKAALLSGDRFKGEVLRSLKAVILNEEVASGKRDEGLDDTTIEQLIAREVKKRNESATIYEGAGRAELAANELSEAEVMKSYLPAQLSESEIEAAVKKIIAGMSASGPSAMGQVIGAVKKELGNSADGALIAKIVKNALN